LGASKSQYSRIIQCTSDLCTPAQIYIVDLYHQRVKLLQYIRESDDKDSNESFLPAFRYPC